MKKLKFSAALVSCATMSFAPVANGAQAKDQSAAKIRALIKAATTPDGKPQTLGEFYVQFRPGLPRDVQKKLDDYIALRRYEPAPKIDNVTTVKDSQGNEQIRFMVTIGGTTVPLTTGAESVRVGSAKLTRNDFRSSFNQIPAKLAKENAQIAKLVKNGKPVPWYAKSLQISLTRAEWGRLTAFQRASYLLRLRYIALDALKVQDFRFQSLSEKNKRKSAALKVIETFDSLIATVLGEEAFAKDPAEDEQIPKPNSQCIVGGYVSVYGAQNGKSCGGIEAGRLDYNKQAADQIGAGKLFSAATNVCDQNTTFTCNPAVYGFKDGKTYCVSKSDVNSATAKCNEASPVGTNEDKQRIVQSWADAMGKKLKLEFNEKGEIKNDHYVLIQQQLAELNGLVAGAMAFCDSKDGRDLVGVRPDQGEACEGLRGRAFDLARFGVGGGPDGMLDNQCVDKPGFDWDAGSKSCKCKDPKREKDGKCAVPAGVVAGGKDKDKDNDDGTIVAIAGIGILLAMGAAALFMGGDDNPPKTPPPQDPIPPTEPSLPVPPVIPDPPQPPVEGNNGQAAPPNAGGVR